MDTMIIGITGGSGSGKTTLVGKICFGFSNEQVRVIPLDAYYKDNSHLPADERAVMNFDQPDAIEFDLLYEHLTALKEGQTIHAPTYDFITGFRKTETTPVAPAPVIILEGILLFTDKRLRELCDIKVYVDAEPDDRIVRILERDIKERGRSMNEVLERYENVKAMHTRYIESTRKFADIIVPKGGENRIAIEVFTAVIGAKLQQTAFYRPTVQ